MLECIRGKLSFANVTSMMALTVALGGTSYAAITLPANSVGSKQIKAGAVKGSEIGGGAVTSAKVRNGSLLAQDFKGGQLPAGAAGATGAPGPAGSPGAAGAPGPAGATGGFASVTARSATATVDLGSNAKASYDVYCPAGQQGAGGGGRGDDTASQLTSVTSSRPAVSTTSTEPPGQGQSFTGWRITVSNLGANPGIRPTVWVICVPAPAA
ncbi:MAG TPA: hypothetical protein VGO80_08805 [Solirubrobacteraceae bacterium]|nr:hypothetical protein [Solirubrobacteraceae bacterium]